MKTFSWSVLVLAYRYIQTELSFWGDRLKRLVRDQQAGRGWKQREDHNFLSLRKGRGQEKWAVRRRRVMQIYARDHVEVHPQKKKEVLYLVKTKNKKTKQRNITDINCEVLLQEFNKYLLFIYNTAVDQLVTL